MNHIFLLLLLLKFLFIVQCDRIQHSLETTYVISGRQVIFPCAKPAINDVLEWQFLQNGSSAQPTTAAHNFQGTIEVFGQFSIPAGRTNLINGNLNITDVGVPDEGEYWCEVRGPGHPVKTSDRYPLHVYVRPFPPEIIPQGVDPTMVLEYTSTVVARCKSTGGKPAAKLSWWNGTTLMPNANAPVVTKNPFNNNLWDITLDLKIKNWTRFDHRRNFTCLVEHPAYEGNPIRLNHSVNVLYHPVNARIWANLTSPNYFVYCEADAYRPPTYSWVLPSGAEEFNVSVLNIPNLFELPSNQYFQCTADNHIPNPDQVRILVEDLRYPNGRPETLILGLPVYIWIAIGGGALVAIIILIIIIYCCCCKKKKDKDDLAVSYTRPDMKQSNLRHSQASLLEFDSMRTPDGRESSVPPSEARYNKADMARAYSLENIAERKYNDPRSSVMLPLKDRDNLYNDSSLNRRASREEIDKIADHIEVLNKSWDNLAQSREHLSRSREELRVELPPRYEAHDDYRDRPAVQDAYPYMDDTVDSRYRNPGNHPNDNHWYNDDGRRVNNTYGNDYRGNEPYDDRYRDEQGRGDGYQGNQYHDQDYRGNQTYNDGNQGYDDRYQGNQHYGDSNTQPNYQQSDYHDRQASYGDSEFDDDEQRGGYGYQPASMI